MDRLRLDLRFALRQLRRRPLFTVAAVGTLALGIGAATAVFSVTDAVLLRPLPYPAPDRLVVLRHTLDGRPVSTSEPEYLDYRADRGAFEGLAAIDGNTTLLQARGRSERLRTAAVTHELFDVLGVAPVLGRTFDEAEDRPGGDPVVVLSYGLWRSAYGGKASILGRDVRLDGEPNRVVGVMPPGFAYPDEETRAWTPLRIDEAEPWGRNNHYLSVVGRLRPGADLEQVQERITATFERGVAAFPDAYSSEETWGVELTPLLEDRVGSVRPALLVLSGAVLALLLIACANVSHLLLGRAATRREEVGLRVALGARSRTLLSQFLVEGAVLSVLGGAAGTVLAWGGLHGLLALYPDALPRAHAISLDGRALGAAALLTLVTALLFGLAPLVQGLRAGVRDRLASPAGRSRGARLQIASQSALATLLFVGSVLLVRSFVSLLGVDPGFRWDHTLTATVLLPEAQYPEKPQVAAAYGDLLERVRALHGVVEAGAIWDVPTVGGAGASSWSVAIEGRPATAVSEVPDFSPQFVTPGTFETLGVELLAGRAFDVGDVPGRQPVAIVNQAMARQAWPGESAIGKRFRMFPEGNPWITVVGVVADVRQQGVTEAPRGEMYFPHRQSFESAYTSPREMTLLLRHGGDAEALAPALRRAVAGLPGPPALYDVRSLQEIRSLGLARDRLVTTIFGLFSASALALAAVGIYGVLAWEVARRRRELGVRVALGAARGRLVGSVVRRGLVPALAGLAVGLAAALALGRVLSSLLHGVQPRDPASFGVAAATVVLVAALASLLPARTASRTDPAAVLRGE